MLYANSHTRISMFAGKPLKEVFKTTGTVTKTNTKFNRLFVMNAE